MHSDCSVSLTGTSSSSPLRSQDLAPPSQPSLRADSVSPEAPPLMDKLQQLMKEKQSVEAELQRCQEAEREATEQVRRSEPSLPVCCVLCFDWLLLLKTCIISLYVLLQSP